MARTLPALFILLSGVLFLPVPSATADVCTCAGNQSDDFGDEVNTWIPSGTCGFEGEFSGSLRTITGAGGCNGYAQLRLEPSVCGDFEVQIDFGELGGYAVSGTRIGGLRVQTTSGSPVAGIELFRTIAVGGCNPAPTNYKAFGADSSSCASTYAATGGTSGKFRLSRQGTTVKAFYWNGATWVELLSTNGPVDELQVFVYSRAFQDFNGAGYFFDNFVLTSEFCPTPAAPSTWSRIKAVRSR